MLTAFFSWWYGQGWIQVAQSFKPRLAVVSNSFSVRQLIPTLFSPWRRIVSDPGRSLEDKWRAAVDNAFSRVVGFFVRIFVLLAALVCMLLIALGTLLELMLWPFLPIAVPVLIILGVVG